MLPIAGQTAGPNGLKFFADIMGGRGVSYYCMNTKGCF